MAHGTRSDECRQIFEMLSQYLDMELPPDACRDIESHLAGCPPCIEFKESLRRTVELCHKYQPGEIPGPIGQAARQRLMDAWQRAVNARNSR